GAAGAEEAGGRLIGHAVAVGVGDADAVAVVLFLRDRFAQIVKLGVVNRPVEAGALGAFAADLGRDEAVPPIVENIGDPVAGARASGGVLCGLGEVAVANVAVVVDILRDRDHVAVTGADQAAYGAAQAVEGGFLNRAGRQFDVILPTPHIVAEARAVEV